MSSQRGFKGVQGPVESGSFILGKDMEDMTKFEQIGVTFQQEAESMKEAKRKFGYSCDLCCCRGLHISCDHCAIAAMHKLVMKSMRPTERLARA